MMDSDKKQTPSVEQNGHEVSFIGRSETVQSIRALIKQVAPSDISVLITGESGTGKEVVAKLIHQQSRRSEKPLITVNCGAIPEGIFESEVFGHERGSFTGAEKQRKGYFELADGGSIFLDEIGEMPLSAQVKILRILETGEFMRVGGTKIVRADVRVITATNRDIAAATSRGEFRSDLYFRLKAVNIYIPALRERREDIQPLAEFFVRDFCRRNGINPPEITPEGMELLTNAYWEGNVRELKNFMESVVTLERGNTIGRQTISQFLGPQMRDTAQLPVAMFKSQDQLERELIYRTMIDLRRDMWELKAMVSDFIQQNPVMEVKAESLEDMEKEQIRHKLEEYGGNRRKTAQALGIGERTLYRKLKEFGLT